MTLKSLGELVNGRHTECARIVPFDGRLIYEKCLSSADETVQCPACWRYWCEDCFEWHRATGRCVPTPDWLHAHGAVQG
jgi:hypothetical protein